MQMITQIETAAYKYAKKLLVTKLVEARPYPRWQKV